MARRIDRGDVWLADLPTPDKRRPVVVLSRSSLIEVLETVTVADVTSTQRGSPTEVALAEDAGLKHSSCVNLTNVFTLRQSALARHLGVVPPATLRKSCAALRIAVGCDE